MDVKDSCVFYADWLEAAHTIEDPKLRCCFYEAVLQYALTGMEMETPPELKIVMTIVKKCIDRDREKYEKICEKRKEAINKRWNKTYQDITNDTNEYNCIQKNTKVTDNDNANDNVNGNANVNDKDNNDFKKTPTPPRGRKAAIFEDLYYRVVSVSVNIPKAIEDLHYEKQYVWRMAECIPGYGVEISEAIRTQTGPALQNSISDINKRYMPKTPFEDLKLAMAIARLKITAQKKAFFDEYRRSENEPDIIRILTEKAEYINSGGSVTSLTGFMKSRK